MIQVYKKQGIWYYMGDSFKDCGVDLYRLLMRAKDSGEMKNV